MGFTDLKNDITGTFNNAAGLLGFNTDEKFPKKLAQTISNVIDENDGSWKKSLGYSFAVVRFLQGQIVPATFEGESWSEFILQINPQEISQDEIFAIEVTPTFSGIFVEHQGSTLKDIRISGTTGLSPGRNDNSGSYPQSGRPAGGKGVSGYKEFHDLRTYVRTYVEAKRRDTEKATGELRLVWKSFRDKEALFVEPQKFTMKRTAGKPFLYDYDIQLKAIGVADFQAAAGGWAETLDAGFETVTQTLEATTKVLQASSDIYNSFLPELKDTIIAPLAALQDTIVEFNKTGGFNSRGNSNLERAIANVRNASIKVKKK
jgi:hypothetical protein